MVLSHTPEPVGVGSPNPLGKETSPLRWMTHRKLSRLSLQRSDMSQQRDYMNPRAPEEAIGIVAPTRRTLGAPNPSRQPRPRGNA